ncbi:MAG: right-handed parallel beta-helix repeat-containing protein, partial [Psychroserpens sp.]|nr:right-handed parallel beta-helix repeat-containing protein [Psychroserpens sp.]
MKQFFIFIGFICCWLLAPAQQEFHVFPETGSVVKGTSEGNGSLENPWDLQTALYATENIKPGDTLWLHEGVYNGRFISTLESVVPNQFITVSGYKNDIVILNGNVNSERTAVLEVKGAQVIYQHFEVTWLGDFSRDKNDEDFQPCAGIRHLKGENCRFYNLKVYNNPALGIGSWKHGGGTVIQNCMIYNNGFMSKDGKGRGEGIYVQNKSDDTRLIKDNIIFNNYYKGIEVWSAGRRAKMEVVKNITLKGNIIFNSGSPSGIFRDNLIVASNDRNGINVAKNIKVLNNIFYHNSSNEKGNLFGEGPSLTLGFRKEAPIESTIVRNNIIMGGYNGLRLLNAKSLEFSKNIVYSGIIQVAPTISDYYQNWSLKSNRYFSPVKGPFRIPKVKDYTLESWNQTFKIDWESSYADRKIFDLKPVLKISRNAQKSGDFFVALYQKQGQPVSVNFNSYNIEAGTSYTIYDVENPNVILKEGKLSDDQEIVFPMQLKELEKPLHNEKAI